MPDENAHRSGENPDISGGKLQYSLSGTLRAIPRACQEFWN